VSSLLLDELKEVKKKFTWYYIAQTYFIQSFIIQLRFCSNINSTARFSCLCFTYFSDRIFCISIKPAYSGFRMWFDIYRNGISTDVGL